MATQSRKGALRALLLVLLVLSGSVLALRMPGTWEVACTMARRHLPDVLGLDVGIGRCELDPLGSRVVVHGFSLFLPGEDTPLVAADTAEVQLGFLRPFSGRLSLALVRAERPRVTLDVSKPSTEPSKKSQGCFLAPLEHVRIAKLDVTGAELRLTLPEGRRVEVADLDLRWTERWGAIELDAEARRGLVRLGPNGQELALQRLAIAGALDPDEELLELERAEVSLDDISTTVSGRVDSLCQPHLALDAQVFLPMRTLSQAKLLPKQATGHLWSRVSIAGKPEAPAVSLELSGNGLGYDRFGPANISARLSYSGDEVRIEDVTVPVGAGRVSVTGRLGLTPLFPLEVSVKTVDASLGRILDKAGVKGAWVDFPATLDAQLSGNLLPRFSLSGPLDLRTGKFTLATRPFDAPATDGLTILEFDKARAQAQVRLQTDRVSFNHITADAGHSKVQGDVALLIGGALGLDIHGQGDLDLADFGHIAGLKWAGRGNATYSITGPVSQVKVESGLSFRDFVFWGFSMGVLQGKLTYSDGVLAFPSFTGQKGRTQYFGKAAVGFGRLLNLRLEVNVPQGRTEDLVDVVSGLTPALAVMQGTLTGTASGRVEVDSPVERLEGLVAFDVKDTAYFGRRMGDGSARLRFVDGKAMVLERTELRGPLGRTWAEGTLLFAGGLDYRFGGDKLSLAETVGPEVASRMGIQGTLEMDGVVSGTSDVPVVDVTLKSPRVTFADRSLGAMDLTGRLVGKDLEVWGRPFQDAEGRVKMKVQDTWPYDATLSLSLPEIRPLLPSEPLWAGVSGSVSGSLTAKGPLMEPRSAHLRAEVNKLVLSRNDVRGENAAPILLSYEKGKLDVQPFRFSGPYVDLNMGGWMTTAGGIGLTLRGGGDLRLLESLAPAMVERATGRVTVDAEATGTMDAPSVVGSAELSEVRVAMRDMPVNIRNLSARAELTGQRMLLEHLQGQLNEGRISARGDIRLARFLPQRLGLTVQLDEVPYRLTEDLPATFSGLLQVVGPPRGFTVTGGLDIVKMRYQKALDVDALLKSMQKRAPALSSAANSVSGEQQKPWVIWDVNVHFGDVRVDNNLAKARMLGDIRLTGTDLRPGLLGRVELAEGSQAFFRNNPFTISQGQMEFQDASSLEPVFEVQAQTQVREYVVKLHAFGKPSDPQILLSSEPALVEGDIVSLLTLGFTSSDRETAASAGAGLAAEALFNVSGLDRQVQRFLPSNPVLRDLSLQISTTYNDATRQAEPTAQLESKFLSEQLKVGMTQPVSGRGTRARAEYRFDDRLSAQAQWDNENSEASFGNLGLELKLSWEVE
ncbi:translocation/assembly module TamB domain-containing protein [Myxococcus landrumensis]|uniref:Translocation/assembly module TamB domain-containing protein n=1 Tax=Myxococcus landrumensis TaxID=2813577 RepID=A0ABX7N481_9BACT|nr:translocation/assembly module TamB domain-containing protein [Myxococcus landrumus]QSQ13542.1 translocation/assembly module TamB domain-containing protein [Myxococcus landrumus]